MQQIEKDTAFAFFSKKNIFNSNDFYEHFQQKINSKQWESATQLLNSAAENIIENKSSDSTFIKTSTNFINNHSAEISLNQRVKLYINIGLLLYYNQENYQSIYYFEKAISEASTTDIPTLRNKAKAYLELSYSCSEIGLLDKSLKSAFEALDISSALKDTLNIGHTYDAIAGVYSSTYDYQIADTYYKKAIETLKSTHSKEAVLKVLINQIALYHETKNPKINAAIEALFKYYQESGFKNDSYKMYVYGWYSMKLLNEKNIKEAKKYLLEVLPIFEKSNEKFLYDIYLLSANLYTELTNETLISTDVYTNALEQYKENKDYISQIICYDVLIHEAIKKNDYKTALKYTQEQQSADDSLANNNLIIKTKEIDKKYQTDKIAHQIIIQEKELSQKNTFIAFLVASLAVLILAILAYYLWQRQQILQKEKKDTLNFTKQLLENTEDERKRIAGDLHDSISHELLVLKSQLGINFEAANSKIDDIINDIRNISRNLHPVMFEKTGIQPNIEQLVERIQEQHNFLVSTDISYSGGLKSSVELQVYRIIQEALTNVIKYANAHAAKITINETATEVFVEIRDNGMGFNVKETLESNKAFGLHNIIERSRVVGGKTTILSSSDGTIITLLIPKNI